MDQARFQEAKASYDSGDFRAAAKGFLAAAGRGTEGNGSAYHMAGNSLMRLRRYTDAVTVYGHALRDELYDKRGAVHVNLAMALNSIGEYPEAVKEYEAALDEADYRTPHKALQGMAGALVEMGKHDDAAAAYRQAALDSENPDPGKALNNLGLCFMALGRPRDAIESYKAALGFDEYEGRGRTLANLGIAFYVLKEFEESVKAFEKATQLHSYQLPPEAVRAYEASRAAAPKREVVEGWSTGEIPPVVDSASGSGVAIDASVTSPDDTGELRGGLIPSVTPTEEVDFDSEEHATGDTTFFTMTDEEMKEIDREARRSERRDRREGRNPWSIVVVAVAGVVVVVGAIVAAFYFGLGYPTQAMTVGGMLDARFEGAAVDNYWVAVPSADVDREMAKIPPMSEYSIEQIERSPRTSRAVVTVTPEDGSPLKYEISLAREGVGWKVTGVENDWTATGGGS